MSLFTASGVSLPIASGAPRWLAERNGVSLRSSDRPTMLERFRIPR